MKSHPYHHPDTFPNTGRVRKAKRSTIFIVMILAALTAVILLGCAEDSATTPPPETRTAERDATGTAQAPSPDEEPAPTKRPEATAAPASTPAPTPAPGATERAATPVPMPTATPAADPGRADPQETTEPQRQTPPGTIASGEILTIAAKHLGLNEDQETSIGVKSWEAVSWNDGSMGCAQEGFAYTQAETPGYRIVLIHDGKEISVHTDETGRTARLAVGCVNPPGNTWRPRTPGEHTVNLPEPTPAPPEALRTEPSGVTVPPALAAVAVARPESYDATAATTTASTAVAAPSHGAPHHPWPPRQPRHRPPTGPDATFEAHNRQEFVQASDDPVSTFSLDVDTTSYQIAVGWTQAGIRIDRDSVRAEEWVNALHYGYKPPANDEEFAITSGLYPHPLGGERRVARITAKAPETISNAPLNVTLVLDASGSMAEGNRVDIARKAAETIRESLDEDDRIAVVHFTTDVVRELTVEHTHPDARDVSASIDALIPRGSTNVQAGLNLGVSMASQARTERPEAHNYVILMSDGVANVDATNPFAILETAHDENALNPLRLITVGVGISNYNDPLLETLAQHGNGWYRYLSNKRDAEETFAKENWLALSTPLADQTRAQVTWNPETVDRWRIIGYENRVADDESFTQDRKEFAEIHAGAETTVFYELNLNREANPLETLDLGAIEIRWVNPATGESMSQTAGLTGRASAQYEGPEGEKALTGAVTAVFADLYGAKPEGSRADREELWSLEMLAEQLMHLQHESPRMRKHQDLLFGIINHMIPEDRMEEGCEWEYYCPHPYPPCPSGIPGPCVEPGNPPQLCLSPSGPCYREP